jgi:hypothetical protein
MIKSTKAANPNRQTRVVSTETSCKTISVAIKEVPHMNEVNKSIKTTNQFFK